VGYFHRSLAEFLRFPTHADEMDRIRDLGMRLVFNGLLAFHFGVTTASVPVTTENQAPTPSDLKQGRTVMQLKEAYLDRVLGEVEDLSSRVSLLKGRFAKQKVSVKLEHYWELEYVRTRFTEFKRRIEDLEEADLQDLDRFQEAVEIAWKDLTQAMETLLAALP
jgi:hypothetical protein